MNNYQKQKQKKLDENTCKVVYLVNILTLRFAILPENELLHRWFSRTVPASKWRWFYDVQAFWEIAETQSSQVLCEI